VVVLIPCDGISLGGESQLKQKNNEQRGHRESDPSAGWLGGWGEVLSGNGRHAANCKVNSDRQPCEMLEVYNQSHKSPGGTFHGGSSRGSRSGVMALKRHLSTAAGHCLVAQFGYLSREK